MKVLGKKSKDGSIIGYHVEMSAGLEAIIPEKSFYDESIVGEMVESGYKYYDYHGNIVSADGISIQSLAESEVTDEDEDAMLMYDTFESYLTEQEMQKYITFDVGSFNTVKFLKPFEIIYKTREELMKYLKGFANNYKMVLDTWDVFPLNAICAPEALFTLEEVIASSEEFLTAMKCVEKRRQLRDVNKVYYFLNFAAEAGIIDKSDNYTEMDYLRAYTAWGPDGFNVNVVDKREYFDCISNVYDKGVGANSPVELLSDHIGVIRTKTADEISSSSMYTRAREVLNVVMNKNGEVLVDGNKYYCNDLAAKNTGNVIVDEVQKTNLMIANRSALRSEKPYIIYTKSSNNEGISRLRVSKYSGRAQIEMTIMSEFGAMYKYKINKDLSVMVSDRECLYTCTMTTVSTIDGRRFDIGKALSKDFQLGLLLYNLVYELIKGKVVKPLYKDTMTMLLQNGLTFEGALDYCAAMKCEQKGMEVAYTPLTSITRMFRKWVPDWFVQIFIDDPEMSEACSNPKTPEERYEALYTLYYAIKDTFNDSEWNYLIFCNPMWETLKGSAFTDDDFIYKRCSLELGWDAGTLRNRMFEEAQEHYVDKIETLVEFIESATLLHQGIGKKDDSIKVAELTEQLYQISISIFKEEGFPETAEGFEEFKDKLLASEYFNIDEFLPLICSEAEGCIYDRALLLTSLYHYADVIGVSENGRKIPTPATGIVIIDSVFKEYSIAPSSQRRDIAFSGVRFQLYSDAIRKTGPSRLADINNKLMHSIRDQFFMELKSRNLMYMSKDAYDIYCRNAVADTMSMLLEIVFGKNHERWQIDENGDRVYVRKNFPLSMHYNLRLDVIYKIDALDWQYLTKYIMQDAVRVATSVWEYAYGYYSFNGDRLSWNDIVVNADITPWSVKTKKGWNNFTVYNGPLNLISGESWNSQFRNADYFNIVNQRQGRAPFDLTRCLMGGASMKLEGNYDINFPLKISMYAQERGYAPTMSINDETYNFYIDTDSGFEPLLDYKLRYTKNIRNAPAGKVLLHDVLMSDKYFGLFASFYGVEVPDKPVYVDAGSYPMIFINQCKDDFTGKSFAPYTIEAPDKYKAIEGSVKIGAKLVAADKLRLDASLICTNKEFIYGNFKPTKETAIIYPYVMVFEDSGTKQEYEIANITVEDLASLSQAGICYQISGNKFYFKSMTGDYVLEV